MFLYGVQNLHMSYVMTKRADFNIERLQGLVLENKKCGVIGTGLIGELGSARGRAKGGNTPLSLCF